MFRVFEGGKSSRVTWDRKPVPRRRGRWGRRWRGRPVDRQSARLTVLLLAIGTAVYVQGYGLRVPARPGWSDARAWWSAMPVCGGFYRSTCLVDGDTGREAGRTWRLAGIDTPELSAPQCATERTRARAALDRLAALMGQGYRIDWRGEDDIHGRALVDIVLANGTDAATVLMDEGLAQSWPNSGNVWCGA